MTDTAWRPTRRDLLKGLGVAGALAALGRESAWAADKLVIGVIYVGPRDDYGYNQAQAQAAAAIKKMPGVTVVEQEKVPETTDVQKTMGSMIEQDGATLLFPTSFGYFDPHILKMAEKIPTGRSSRSRSQRWRRRSRASRTSSSSRSVAVATAGVLPGVEQRAELARAS